MLDEDAFVKEALAYDRSPSKTTALAIYARYCGPQSTRPLRISQFVRAALQDEMDAYEGAKEKADQKYTGKNPLNAIKRAASSGERKAQAGVFGAAVDEVKRNKKLTGLQVALLDLTHMKATYADEKARAIADLRVKDLPGTTAQTAQAIRRADLTINFKANAFFSKGVLDRNGYLSMWMRGSSPGDNVDTRERNRAEINAFEQVRYETRFEGQSRPLYAALNVGRRTEGGAGGYGSSYFVLNEAVKKRSTYTPSDSFYIGAYEVSEANLRPLRGKLEPGVFAALQKQVGKVIDDRQEGSPAFNAWINQLFSTLIKENKFTKRPGETAQAFDDRKRDAIQDIREALREPGAEEKVVTSYERMDRIVAYLEKRMLTQISTYANDPNARNLKLPTYVEAQVHGAINFGDDVERMVIAEWEVDGDVDALANLDAFAKKHRIPYSYIGLDQLG